MTREERRALLGPDVLAHIDAIVDAAPEPTPEVVDALRRIFTQPQGAAPVKTAPAADAA
ncbi:hypothetical protein [Streptomyces sp. BK340]|uniref:hypothetical protein n=1 Tax=Streptomyces sp. BK340 TaxID=2572903 RepID=UPI0011AC62F5|nr:hypothetical protein [Streptomyces sp. BK340]TVZ96454.1 hypothetical protein FB157_103365 [Streptomyces sp. BK340]